MGGHWPLGLTGEGAATGWVSAEPAGKKGGRQVKQGLEGSGSGWEEGTPGDGSDPERGWEKQQRLPAHPIPFSYT